MKLVFFIKAMGQAGGDAKRVVADLTAALAGGRGHEVTLASFDCPHDEDLFKLGSAVCPERLAIGDVTGNLGRGRSAATSRSLPASMPITSSGAGGAPNTARFAFPYHFSRR